ncbi:hypothetical protein HK096_001170, partial [Nowakowskiella sp. JEL0078]
MLQGDKRTNMSVSQQEKPKKLSAHEQWTQKKKPKAAAGTDSNQIGTGIDNELLRYLNLPEDDESVKPLE